MSDGTGPRRWLWFYVRSAFMALLETSYRPKNAEVLKDKEDKQQNGNGVNNIANSSVHGHLADDVQHHASDDEVYQEGNHDRYSSN